MIPCAWEKEFISEGVLMLDYYTHPHLARTEGEIEEEKKSLRLKQILLLYPMRRIVAIPFFFLSGPKARPCLSFLSA